MPKPSDLLQGTLDLLILKTLVRDPLHGWGIAKRIQDGTASNAKADASAARRIPLAHASWAYAQKAGAS